MKTTIKLLALAFVLFATACNNDDEMDMFNSLWRNVTQNEARIDDLEKWCAQANTNITSLQTLVKSIEEKKTISNILPIVLNGDTIGYTMNFGDKGPITIYDDSNPVNAPKISVKSENDVYYWTLNGEWLLDENGDKVSASGKDGANGENGQNGTNGQNGITPQLKIENDYWWISYDNGNTWTELGKAKGEDGENGQNGAKGDKGDKGDAGDSMFQSVTQDAANVYFTLADGTVIIIAKGVSNFTPAAFSVSADKQVYFSPGNLQYIQSSDTWQFASFQWECVGTDNVIGGRVSSNPTYGDTKWGDALADKVDLFGWSTSATNFGVSTSEDNINDYSGSFVDWGSNSNQIGADAPNTWRTLTSSEWSYLRYSRTNANDLVGVAQVNGVNGLILLPDSWTCPAGVTFRSGFHDSYDVDIYYAAYQTFTAAEWSKMEVAGAVFLPAAGHRDGSGVYNVRYDGAYWSAYDGAYWSANDSDYARYFHFISVGAGLTDNNRSRGCSVRLVKDL